MPISFKCPLCARRVQFSRRDAATSKACPECGETIPVPALRGTPGVEWDEISTKEPERAPRMLDDETFARVAAELGFPDAAMLERFRELRRERGGDWPLHTVIRASGALSREQEAALDQAVAKLPPAPRAEPAPEPLSKDEMIRRFGATPSGAARAENGTKSTARTRAARVPSEGRVKAPAPTGERDRTGRTVAVVAGVSVLFIAVAVAIVTMPHHPPPTPPPGELAVVASSTPLPLDALLPKKDPAVEEAYRIIGNARSLEHAGKEIDAESLLERGLETTHAPEARRSLIAARRALVERCREKLVETLAEARSLALKGQVQEAQKQIWDHVAHMPVALRPDLEKEVSKLNDELIARAPRAPKNVQVRYPASTQPQAAARSDEPARLDRLEVALDDALRRLDGAAVDRAIVEAGTFKDADNAANVAFMVACVKAGVAAASAALQALGRQVGTEVELALWKGAPAAGTLVKIDGNLLTLNLTGGGQRELDLTELSAKALAVLLRAQGADEAIAFGLGVLAYVHEDLPDALERFRRAPSIAEAAALAKRLETDGVQPPPAKPEKPATDRTKPATGPGAREDPDPPTTGDITDSWPNGRPKRRYSHDEKGRLVGLCTDYFEDGTPRVRSHYRGGVLSGEWLELHHSGKTAKKATYSKGKLEGEVTSYDEGGKVTFHGTYFEDKLLYTRTKDEITRDLAAIDVGLVKTPARPARVSEFAPLDWEAEARALRRLRAYRYLCGLAYDVELNWVYAEKCSAAAKLLELVGHLEHEPKKPAGCSDRLYAEGFEGTSHSNLSQGRSTATETVDGYMDDSDEKNVDRVGHRRWCLNPSMLQTAFGVNREWAAMYALDEQRSVPTPERVCYPPAGWCPARFVAANVAWSVSLDPERFTLAGREATVTVWPAGDDFRKLAPVTLEDVRVNDKGFGTALCVIFRPKGSFAAGRRYWVEIQGFKDKAGAPATIEYFVEFF